MVKSYERVGGPKVMEWSRRFVRVQGKSEREREKRTKIDDEKSWKAIGT
jgi:hypothetical protein